MRAVLYTDGSGLATAGSAAMRKLLRFGIVERTSRGVYELRESA